MKRLNKKEKQLYMTYGKRWDIEIHHIITISDCDRENIYKVMDKTVDKYGLVLLKRVTKMYKIFNIRIYFNTIYGGIENE